MKQIIPKGLIVLGVGVIVTAVILWMNLAGRVSANPLLQAGLPVNGWSVCQDLGIAPSPVGGGRVQHLVMCQGDGWRVHVYCIEPAKPPPPLNTICSMVNANDFWCGDTVQSFRIFSVLETPAPSATVTPSRTPTLTPTSTSTFTPTQTSTPLPSITPTSSATAMSTITVSKNQLFTQTLQATSYYRPHAGGPGNSRLLASILAIVFGTILLGAAVLIHMLRQASKVSRP
jgi:hypothetical protein